MDHGFRRCPAPGALDTVRAFEAFGSGCGVWTFFTLKSRANLSKNPDTLEPSLESCEVLFFRFGDNGWPCYDTEVAQVALALLQVLVLQPEDSQRGRFKAHRLAEPVPDADCEVSAAVGLLLSAAYRFIKLPVTRSWSGFSVMWCWSHGRSCCLQSQCLLHPGE